MGEWSRGDEGMGKDGGIGGELPVLALLAGGLATRLRPLTEKIPKSLVEVGGEPFLAHQLRLLSRQGVREVMICCGFLGEQIERFAGDGSRFGCRVRYSHDGEMPLGTGGALVQALPMLGESFLVMYGDSYLDLDWRGVYRDFERSGQAALMTVFRNEGRWDASNAVFEGGRVTVYDKHRRLPEMRYIDHGAGVLKAEVLEGWRDRGAFDLAEVYTTLATEGRLAGYEATKRFFEIGSHEGLRELDGLLCRAERRAVE